MLTNSRTQYAVGQGGFHAATIEGEGGPKVRYVVDCGATWAYATARNRCIDAYLTQVGARSDIDFLFITHAHADHLNGVDRLLDPKLGVHAKAIVMPMLTVVERLACFARTAALDARSAMGRFYIDFTLDPVGALSQFGPGRIVLVRSGNGDGGAPFSRDGNRPNPDQPGRTLLADQDRGGGLQNVVGFGDAEELPSSAKVATRLKKHSVPKAVAIPDTLGFVYGFPTLGMNWLLAPFVDPAVKADTAKFLQELGRLKELSVKDLLDWLEADPANVKSLLTTDVALLADAYKTVNKDLNVTSLCVYSGPVEPHPPHRAHHHVVTGNLPRRCLISGHDDRLGWLGTGDAALKEQARREAFLAHYGRLLQQVHTFMVPHHGSEGNFDKALLTAINPSHCIAAADYVKNWRHPGTIVVQAAASYGGGLSVVTSAPASQVYEEIWVGSP